MKPAFVRSVLDTVAGAAAERPAGNELQRRKARWFGR